MATNYYATYKRYNGADWDTFYFTTVASQVAETSTRKWLTDIQQGWLDNYLDPAHFNEINKLAQLDASGLLPSSAIPDNVNYLHLTGGTMAADIDMDNNDIIGIGHLYSKAATDLSFGVGVAEYMALKYHVSAPYVQMSYYLDMSSKKIINLAEPTSGTDAATRQFVEQLVAQGTHVVDAARAASTANVTSLSGPTTIDGVALIADDRVLLKNQTTPSQNGMYIVNAGSWTLLPDASDTGSLAFVLEGTLNSGKQFYCNADSSWVLFFVQDSYYATVARGLELDVSGFGFGVADLGISNAMLAGSISNDKLLTIAQSKITAFASADDGSVAAATSSYSLSNHMANIYAMIKSIKGTVGAHTAQGDTISSLRTSIDEKNRSYIGTANPSTSGYISGDTYLQYSV